jgi:hypothetical protein
MLEILFRVLGRTISIAATCAGGVGIYALVCSSLHSHPGAALFAIVSLTSAAGMTLGMPDVGGG